MQEAGWRSSVSYPAGSCGRLVAVSVVVKRLGSAASVGGWVGRRETKPQRAAGARLLIPDFAVDPVQAATWPPVANCMTASSLI